MVLFGKLIEGGPNRSEIVVSEKVSFTEFAPDEGMIRGKLLLVNGYSFEFMEYIKGDTRLKYRFLNGC